MKNGRLARSLLRIAAMPTNFPFVADARDARTALDLLDSFGSLAIHEASIRADAARSVGNHVHFCRWRQMERLVTWLVTDGPVATVH